MMDWSLDWRTDPCTAWTHRGNEVIWRIDFALFHNGKKSWDERVRDCQDPLLETFRVGRVGHKPPEAFHERMHAQRRQRGDAGRRVANFPR